MSTLDCSDKFDPDANYVVADGPLKGGFVTILSVVDNGKRICGLVSDKDWVTPPIWLEASALKKRGRNWSPVSWIPHIVAIATVVLFLVFEATKSPIALGAAAILFAIGAIAFARALILSRRIKSCPICGTRLDPDTWSHCNRCQWQRPMPHFLPAEMRAPRSAAGDKYARLLREDKGRNLRVESPLCPRCRSSKFKRSSLSPRWGGRFTCRDCGRIWYPGHTYVVGCKAPAIGFAWCAGMFIASALLITLTGISPGWIAFMWIGSFTLVFIFYLRNQM
jgi:hypothetical protein